MTAAAEEEARGVAPLVTFGAHTMAAESADLAPGATRTWSLPLPAAPAPGTFAAVVRVRSTDAHGREEVQPLALAVAPPGAAPGPVRATLEVAALSGPTTAGLTLANSGSEPVAGRLVTLIPTGLRVSPESQPVQIPAGGQTRVPLVIEPIGAAPGEGYALHAVLEYETGRTHHAVVASATAPVRAGGRPGRVRPLLVGALMSALALVLLGLAWRSTRRAQVHSGDRPTDEPSG